MKDPIEASAPTVEEAIDRALQQLGVREDEVEIKILAEGGAEGARVLVGLRNEKAEEEIGPDLLDDQADLAEDFLNGLLDVLDMDGEAEAEIEDDVVVVQMNGPEMAVLIGRRGSTLEALHELTRAAVQHGTESRARIALDIEGYRARQQAFIERKARQIAQRVRKDRRSIGLDPMTSVERKVVHTALMSFPGVSTSSEGEEPERRVVIHPA